MLKLEEFEKVKRESQQLLGEAKEEAARDGIDIDSAKFKILLSQIERQFLLSKGVDHNEYNELEKNLADSEMAKNIMSSLKKTKKLREIESDMGTLKSSYSETYSNLGNQLEELKAEISRQGETLMDKDTAIELAKNTVNTAFDKDLKGKILNAHDSFDHMNLIRDLNDFEARLKKMEDKQTKD